MYVLLSNVKYPIVNTRINQFHYFKLNGGLSRLHPVDEDAASWLTRYGSWHAYEEKKIILPRVSA